MDRPHYRPTGVVVISVWLERSVDRSPADAVRARIISMRDVVDGVDQVHTVAGSGAVVAVVEHLLTDWATTN